MSNLEIRSFLRGDADTASPRTSPDLAQTAARPDSALSHYGELMRQNLRAILAAMVLGALVMGGMAYSDLVNDPVYEASVKISVQPSDAELNFSRDFVRSSSFDSVNVLTQSQMEYLLSRDTLRLVSDRLAAAGFAPEAPVEPTGLRAVVTRVKQAIRRLNTGRAVVADPDAALLADLQDAVTLNMIESSFIMQIVVTWPDPDQAALIANTLADVYRERRTTEAASAGAELTGYLTGLRDQTQAEIERLTEDRSALRSQFGILDLTAERDTLLAQIGTAQTERDRTTAELQALETMLSNYPENDPAQQNRRNGLSAEVRDSLALDRIRQVELTELLTARNAGIETLRTRLADLSRAEVPLGRVEADLAAARQRLADVEQRIVDAGLTSAGSIDSLRIIDRAEPPLYPATPGALRSAAIGAAGALVLMIMWIFGRDLRDARVRTRGDLGELFDLRVLGDIRLKTGRDGAIRLKDQAIFNWMGLQHEDLLLLLDAESGHRAAALAFALSEDRTRMLPQLRVQSLTSLQNRSADAVQRPAAVLLTLPRGRIDRPDLIERVGDLRRRYPGARIALAFLDVPAASLVHVDDRIRHTPAPADPRRITDAAQQPVQPAGPAPSTAPRQGRFRLKNDRVPVAAHQRA